MPSKQDEYLLTVEIIRFKNNKNRKFEQNDESARNAKYQERYQKVNSLYKILSEAQNWG